jgi:hypothetical protein
MSANGPRQSCTVRATRPVAGRDPECEVDQLQDVIPNARCKAHVRFALGASPAPAAAAAAAPRWAPSASTIGQVFEVIVGGCGAVLFRRAVTSVITVRRVRPIRPWGSEPVPHQLRSILRKRSPCLQEWDTARVHPKPSSLFEPTHETNPPHPLIHGVGKCKRCGQTTRERFWWGSTETKHSERRSIPGDPNPDLP